MKHTKEDLKIMQSWSLERKIQVTQTRIMEWYNHFEGQVYVSFSGGKDSTVLLDLARRVYPEIEAVFADTGLEYPEIREFVKFVDKVTTIRPDMKFTEVLEAYGYPVIGKEVAQAVYGHNRGWASMTAKFDKNRPYNCANHSYLLDAPFKISHMCCDAMKKKPFKDFGKATGKKAIIGTMTDESQLRMSNWLQNGCNAFDSKKQISTPMSFWTEQDVLQYIKLTNTPYASVYGDIIPDCEHNEQIAFSNEMVKLKTTGLKRTGCMFCMFGVHLEKEPNRFQMMKKTHPKQYDYCMRKENGLNLDEILNYLNINH